ncbi:FAD-binding oxidoreductase [Actinoplanes sp. LDG1-06]|uniref:FAD-binding oxidoreductase n=1 Tax=Paractinoplanes ovalisporus TaxID=2810368 RepID=A0ABS2AR22_9ACTN|nr:FAD-binding oxidoreductase [Actinoplanes ovalisporus]MBM2621651.1 FAD-binding oxidoreductase [Actinoplanes ovalisporus]
MNVIYRGDPGFEEARVDRIFNRRLSPRQPAAIVHAGCERDVADGVRLAVERGWAVTVRSGGHSWAQWSLRDDAVLIDLGGLREMTYDAGIVSVSPAVRGGSELAPFLSAHGRFFPGGHCPTVGLGGFLLQGGQGWNARGWGWAAEHIAAIDVVTADGALVHASEEQNSDLFWAARGAGLAFPGVVTRFHLRTMPEPRQLTQTVQAFRLDDFDEVMTWLHGMHHTVADTVEIVALTKTDRALADEPVLLVTAVAFDDPGALAPFRDNPALKRALLVVDTGPTTMDEQRARQRHDSPEGHRWEVDNAWLSGPPSAVLPAARRVFTELPNDKAFTIWFSMAPLRPLPDMAFSVQSEIYLASYVPWLDPAEDARHREWLRAAMADLEPVAAGRYLGDSDLDRGPVRFLTEEIRERLRAVRARWDPYEKIGSQGLSGDSVAPTASSVANSH